MTTGPTTTRVEAGLHRLARLQRIHDHLDSIYADAVDAAAYLEYGRDLDAGSFDLASDIAQIKAIAASARHQARQLIKRQQARAPRNEWSTR